MTNAFGDNVTFQVRATSNPEGGIGWAFQDYDMGFSQTIAEATMEPHLCAT